MVYQQLIKEQSSEHDMEILYAIDTHIQCIEECLDYFMDEIWPHLQNVKFAHGCAYKRADSRKEFEELSKEFANIMSESIGLMQQRPTAT